MDTKQDHTDNFMYFGHNYNHDFISKVWGDGIAKHLQSKFSRMYEQHGTMTFFRWYMELDNRNKVQLMTWIENNYRK